MISYGRAKRNRKYQTKGIFNIRWNDCCSRSFWRGVQFLQLILDRKYDIALDEFDQKYGIEATAIAQDPEWQRNVTGRLYYASGTFVLNNDASCCSTSFIGKDADRNIIYLLTANHCLPTENFETLTIRQPQLPGSSEISVKSQDVRFVSHPEGKDIAIIAVKSSQAVEQLPTIPYSAISAEGINKELCAMVYPGLMGKDYPQTPMAIKTNMQHNMFGQPRKKENLYVLESSGWGGMSGGGFSICQNDTVIGVVSEMGPLDHGEMAIELLDSNVDQMILEAGNLFGH